MPSRDDEIINLMDSLMAAKSSPLAATPDGAFVPAALDEPLPIPAISEETLICTRGPCKYYMEMENFFPAGNTESTLQGKAPRQITRYCMRMPQTAVDLLDEAVYGCNQWAPLDEAEKHDLARRRDLFRIKTPAEVK